MKNPSLFHEVNFDGLIGPTHHFAGLAFGNVASMTSKGRVSNPREAALQGLRKMKALHDLGLKQGVIPPVQRPDFGVLKNLGFSGNYEKILKQLFDQSEEMVSAFFSASSMWTANSATVSPSSDTRDGKVHLTPANLTSKFHRALEATGTEIFLRAIFSLPKYFTVHTSLFSNPVFGDEGAANHTRLCESYGGTGLELFVFGRNGLTTAKKTPKKFPARQTIEASQSVARLHQLKEEQVVFWQQNPKAIDAGAFHNDVVAVGNGNLLFFHQDAFLNSDSLLNELKRKFAKISQDSLSFLCVPSRQVSLKDAVQSYLFNSQVIKLPSGETLLLAPVESEENRKVRAYLEGVVGGEEIQKVKFVDLRESMLNGGGPACLRLRVVLSHEELKGVNPGVLMDDVLFNNLEKWIRKNYRDRLEWNDLCDPRLIAETEAALDELTKILKLGPVYPFQFS